MVGHLCSPRCSLTAFPMQVITNISTGISVDVVDDVVDDVGVDAVADVVDDSCSLHHHIDDRFSAVTAT